MQTWWQAMVTIAIALPACGRGASTPRSLVNVAPALARIACPSPADDVARVAWQRAGGVVSSRCVALIAAGRALWKLEGTWDSPRPEDLFVEWHLALIDAGSRAVLWQSDGVDGDTVSTDATVIDLDGDGDEEIVYVWGEPDHDGRGHELLWLVVDHVEGDGLVSARMPVPFSDGATGCASTFTAADGVVEVITTQPPGTAGGCLTSGRHRFRWDGKALVEVLGSP
jgi:hypothetical protein